MKPYVSQSNSRPSLLQRLFKNVPSASAIAAINNLLAEAAGIGEIDRAKVQQVLKDYHVKFDEQFRAGIEAIYGDYLAYCLEDKTLSADELADLKALAHLLGLSEGERCSLDNALVLPILRKATNAAVNDWVLTDEEGAALEAVRVGLAISEEDAREIRSAAAGRQVQALVDAAVKDRRFSPAEEEEINAVASQLGLTLTHSKQVKQALALYRTLWEIENAERAAITTEARLNKGELCFWSGTAAWCEERKERGAALMRELDRGTLYVTSSRLLLVSDSEAKGIPLSKVVEIVPGSNGMRVLRDPGKEVLFQISKGAEVAAAHAKRSLRDAT